MSTQCVDVTARGSIRTCVVCNLSYVAGEMRPECLGRKVTFQNEYDGWARGAEKLGYRYEVSLMELRPPGFKAGWSAWWPVTFKRGAFDRVFPNGYFRTV